MWDTEDPYKWVTTLTWPVPWPMALQVPVAISSLPCTQPTSKQIKGLVKWAGDGSGVPQFCLTTAQLVVWFLPLPVADPVLIPRANSSKQCKSHGVLINTLKQWHWNNFNSALRKNLTRTGFFNVQFVEIEFSNEQSHLWSVWENINLATYFIFCVLYSTV